MLFFGVCFVLHDRLLCSENRKLALHDLLLTTATLLKVTCVNDTFGCTGAKFFKFPLQRELVGTEKALDSTGTYTLI